MHFHSHLSGRPAANYRLARARTDLLAAYHEEDHPRRQDLDLPHTACHSRHTLRQTLSAPPRWRLQDRPWIRGTEDFVTFSFSKRVYVPCTIRTTHPVGPASADQTVTSPVAGLRPALLRPHLCPPAKPRQVSDSTQDGLGAPGAYPATYTCTRRPLDSWRGCASTRAGPCHCLRLRPPPYHHSTLLAEARVLNDHGCTCASGEGCRQGVASMGPA